MCSRYFFANFSFNVLTIYLNGYIIIARKEENGTVKKHKGKKKSKKKKPIKWRDLAINALIDLIIGTVLILIDKLIK